MKKKRLLILIGSTCLVLALVVLPFMAACAPTPPEEEAPPSGPPAMTLKVGSPYPRGSMLGIGTTFFVDEIVKRTEGRITFDEYWGGTLTRPDEILDATGSGRVDICTGLWIYAPGKVPLGSFEYNFMFNQPDRRVQAKIKREMYETIPALNGELAKFNVGPNLQFWALSPYDVMSPMPLKTLEDLKGKRFDSTPVEYTPVVKAIGMSHVPTPAPEFYEVLDRGTVDMVCCCRAVLHMFKIQEVAPYFLDTHLNTPCTMGLWINLDTWNNLTPEDRELFRQVGKDTEEMAAAWMDERLAKVDEDFVEAGVVFSALSEEDIKQWCDVMPDVPAEWAEKMEAKGLPGWEIVDTYIELSEREGWEWPRKWGQR